MYQSYGYSIIYRHLFNVPCRVIQRFSAAQRFRSLGILHLLCHVQDQVRGGSGLVELLDKRTDMGGKNEEIIHNDGYKYG